MKILIAVGGTGGHLLPAQQLADELSPHAEVLFAGGGLAESRFFDREKFAFRSIVAAPWTWRKGLIFTGQTLRGTGQAIRLVWSWKPDLVIGFGSYHAFPVLLAALLCRRKTALFEANCLLGRVNRLFAPFASLITSQFPLTKPSSKTSLVPLLPWKKEKQLCPEATQNFFSEAGSWEQSANGEKKSVAEAPLSETDPSVANGLSVKKKKAEFLTILVFGGSQGAQFLNEMIPLVVPVSLKVIHITGNEQKVEEVRERYRKRGIPASVIAFEKEMAKAYTAADFAICRAGASTLAELIRYEVPALFIPYPFAADDHQRINAEFLAKKVGGAKMIKQEDATLARLIQEIDAFSREIEVYRANLAKFRKSCEGRTSLKEQILRL